MAPDFTTVTEVSGDDVSVEQVERLCHRYAWAGPYCEGKDVLEIACGSGQGLGYLASKAKSLRAGDIDQELVRRARETYGKRVQIDVMDALDLPFEESSLDVVILFEALYYMPDIAKFFQECSRVLRPGGYLLIVSANKDMSDFNPSPYSHTYLGTVELHAELSARGFRPELFGYWPYEGVSMKQRLLRPIKKIVVSTGLMPKTMAGKKLLKRVVFGQLVPMPAEVTAHMCEAHATPSQISGDICDKRHRVIYCAAQRL